MVLALCILYHCAQAHSFECETTDYVDQNLFRDEFLFNHWQQFIGENPPLYVSQKSLNHLKENVTKRSPRDNWVLYGAGTLTKCILKALKPEDNRPIAVISGYACEQGERIHGVPIKPPAEIPPNATVVIATRSRYYPTIENLLSKQVSDRTTQTDTDASNLNPIVHWFEYDKWESVTPRPTTINFSEQLHNAVNGSTFTLRWVCSPKKTPVYDLPTLVNWGRTVLKQMHPRPQQGDILPIALPTSPLVYALFYAAILEGLAPTLLSYPTPRRDPLDYKKQIKAVMENLGARVLICDPTLGAALGEFDKMHLVTDCFKPITSAAPQNALVSRAANSSQSQSQSQSQSNLAPSNHNNEAPLRLPPTTHAFIQHSSGTTGIQKAVPITHEQLIEQINHYGRALVLESGNVIASWLPLYHDMGLITSLIGPAIWGVPVVACDPSRWIEQPTLILDMMDRFNATHTWWPNFAFALLAKLLKHNQNRWDLSHVRHITSCSEPLTHDAVDAFIQAALLQATAQRGERLLCHGRNHLCGHPDPE